MFAQEITAIGAERDDVVCVTAAMLHPTGLGGFATRFPGRVLDVGIAEQHAVTCAAGLAAVGALAAAGADTCAAAYVLPPRFLPHASRDQILRAHGLDAAGITTTVLTRLASTHQGKAMARPSRSRP